ncbi:MAG: DUF1553 domain-containing protein, partial [Cyclobacteriaceae bacterium]|nr:DUF1553 domain-containing protein [Cyclobacteriaceae bacterium]
SVQADPENILLSRGPGYRLPAEMIRDNALAASGLLNREVGGESVKPYQPEGLWIELGNFSYFLMRYKEDKGKKLYRRSMYTFIRRTSPPPYMTTFDAPSREVCTVDRPRTNTPLQALILLNDPQFVEASKVLAERMATLGKESLDDQITVGFRLATGRRPESREIAVLRGMYNNELERFSDHPKEAEELLQVGEYVMNKEKDRVSLAALTMVANTILNHDEAYMKR